MRGLRFVVISLLVSSSALADEPTLGDYVKAALAHNPGARISKADLDAAEAARLDAFAALLPSISAQAEYVYNQYPAIVGFPNGAGGVVEITITAQHAQDGTAAARIPLLDLGALERWRAARDAAKAAGETRVATDEELALSVARAYYGAIAAHELLDAAQNAQAAAEQNAKIVAARLDAGTATPLNAQKADLEVARDEQATIDARRAWLVARRLLATLTGLPEPDSITPPSANGAAVGTEDDWQRRAATDRPELIAAQDQLLGERATHRAATFSWAPTLTGHFTERFQNAAGFTGKETYYYAGVSADWLLDFHHLAEQRRSRATLDRAQASFDNERAKVVDDVHSAWLDYDSAQAKLAAARRGADVAKKAADETRARFSAGTVTQLEIVQSDRDQLQAEVDRIRAEADLAVARLALSRAAGQPIAP